MPRDAPLLLEQSVTHQKARLALGLLIVAAIFAAYVATSPELAAAAVAQAGPDLTRLMRGMAAIKALMAVAAGAAVMWRLGAPVTWRWFAAYALACTAMAAGPVVIWQMQYLRLGALLLHGGLFTTVVLLWRDPAMGRRLEDAVNARRLALRAKT
jgi:hypothetical protein